MSLLNETRLNKSESLRPPDYSDAGNASVFSRLYRDDLIYTDALGWLWWNGRRWERDEHRALSWAIAMSDRMLAEAREASLNAIMKRTEERMRTVRNGGAANREDAKAAEKEEKDAAVFLRHAQNLRSARQLKNMVELSTPSLVLKAEKLDANPFDLNTPTDIVDLRSGRIRPHEREAYCSRIKNASPGKKGAEMWLDFLRTITRGDGGVQGFLQMTAGMALIGSVYYEGLIIAHGEGRNGKSTFFNALSEVLGSYTGSIDIRTLTTDRSNKGAALATLRGKRLVITGELEEYQRWVC